MSNQESKLTYFDVLQWASGFFLTERFPSNWEDMEEEEQNQFIIDNAWQPFEYWGAEDVYDVIASLAYSTKRKFLK